MHFRFTPSLLILCLLLGGAEARAQQRFDAAQLLADVRHLASDELAGRRTGTEGGRAARAYVEERFAALGVKPFGEGYRHAFRFEAGRDRTPYEGVNVVGFVPGTALPDSFIVLSAHYDHVGVREGAIYNGADDNASGTAALLAAAEFLTRHPLRRSVILAAFDAEELGLQGARAFVERPPVPLGRIRLNVNMDMLSRSEKQELWAAGTAHYPQLRAPLERAGAGARIRLRLGHDTPDLPATDDWTSSSDHAAFHRAGIPFVYFGVEDHPDYHQPTDDYRNIDPAFFIHAADLVLRSLVELDGDEGASGARPPAPGAELLEVRKVWDAAPHSAFTDLVRFEGKWFFAFREGARHVLGGDGTLRVLVSDDGLRWESAASLAAEGIDLRDPKLSVTPDGRLMLVAGGSIYRDERLATYRSRVAFSDDGRSWTTPEAVLGEREWLWRVTWHDGRAYGVAYATSDTAWSATLHASRDGLRFEPVAGLDVPGRPNETTLRFLPGGEMMAVVRREAGDRHAWIGTSRHPFTEWSWRDAGHSLGGPNFIVLPDGRVWAAGRSGGKTVLGTIGPAGFEPALVLPSDGDNSYPGLVWHDGLLWISYYSSHEGRTAVYLAKVRLPEQ